MACTLIDRCIKTQASKNGNTYTYIMMHPSQQSETKRKDNHYNMCHKRQYNMLKCHAVTEIFYLTLSESSDSDLKYEVEDIVNKKEQELAKFIT